MATPLDFLLQAALRGGGAYAQGTWARRADTAAAQRQAEKDAMERAHMLAQDQLLGAQGEEAKGRGRYAVAQAGEIQAKLPGDVARQGAEVAKIQAEVAQAKFNLDNAQTPAQTARAKFEYDQKLEQLRQAGQTERERMGNNTALEIAGLRGAGRAGATGAAGKPSARAELARGAMSQAEGAMAMYNMVPEAERSHGPFKTGMAHVATKPPAGFWDAAGDVVAHGVAGESALSVAQAAKAMAQSYMMTSGRTSPEATAGLQYQIEQNPAYWMPKVYAGIKQLANGQAPDPEIDALTGGGVDAVGVPMGPSAPAAPATDPAVERARQFMRDRKIGSLTPSLPSPP
jgi:hypothetical protein